MKRLDLMVSKFVENYLNDETRELLKFYESNPIKLNTGSVCEWLLTQPPAVLGLIEPVPIWSWRLQKYDYMIKGSVKPKLDVSAPYEYSALQTIAYSKKSVNAYFCSIVKDLKKRIMSVLDESRWAIFTDCSIEEFAECMNRMCKPSELVNMPSLEIDISKYDKSQGSLFRKFEQKLMKLFGMTDYDLMLWNNAHEWTQLSNIADGVKAKVHNQRKSGDAATFLGNTLCLMGVIAVGRLQLCSCKGCEDCDRVVYELLSRPLVPNPYIRLAVDAVFYRFKSGCVRLLFGKRIVMLNLGLLCM